MDMEEEKIIQLNLTKEELIILQAMVAVAAAVHLRDVTRFERNVYRMESYMDKWPELSGSLSDKMTNSLEVILEIIKGKPDETKVDSSRTKKV